MLYFICGQIKDLTVNKCNNLTQNKLEKCKKTKIIIWLAYFVAFFKKIQ
jgi:hypothetical protein